MKQVEIAMMRNQLRVGKNCPLQVYLPGETTSRAFVVSQTTDPHKRLVVRPQIDLQNGFCGIETAVLTERQFAWLRRRVRELGLRHIEDVQVHEHI